MKTNNTRKWKSARSIELKTGITEPGEDRPTDSSFLPGS